MRQGGIFNGPTALGIPEQGIFNNAAPLGSAPRGIFRNAAPMGLGSVNVGQCVFATWTKSAGAQAIQEELIRRGATKLKADGLWGPCSESAWQKVTGVPLTRASLESQFGIVCSSWNKAGIFDVKKCTDGTDAVTVKPSPEVVSVPPPGTKTPQVVCNPPYVPDPMTGGCKMGATKPPPVKVTVPPTAKPPVPASSPPAAKADEWIKGVPNLAVIGAGVFVVGGLAIFMLTRESSPDAVANATRRKR